MDKIYITKNDYDKLTDLINKKWDIDDNDKALLLELKRAEIVEPKKIPKDVITMNSLVSFVDVESKDTLEYWLVFPQDADIDQNKISVLSPIGCALLGYKINDTVTLKTPEGEKKIRIEKILRQSGTKESCD